MGYPLITVSGSTIESNYFGWNIAGTGARIKTLGNNHIQENIVSQGALTVASLRVRLGIAIHLSADLVTHSAKIA